ncbi:MAG: SMI1/KNR4 family protein [Ardenticatenaceae bacterium]
MSFEKVKARFEELELVASFERKGCTEAEVNLLEQSLLQTLPQAYRKFLLWMGHGAGSFWQGSHCFYKHLGEVQKWAVELLQEDHFPQQMPLDAFVFCMHQGYMFAFFRLSEGDDPPVYFYYAPEHPTDFKLSWNHFSEFLLAEADSYKRYEEEVEKAIAMMENYESKEQRADQPSYALVESM